MRYSGEPVAVVVAESRYAAEDASERIEVEYEPLEPASTPSSPLTRRPVLTPTRDQPRRRDPVEVAATRRGVRRGRDVIAGAPELPAPRGGAAGAARARRRGRPGAATAVTVWGAAKVPHINRRILARLLGLPEEQVRLVELDVGGGFGARGEFYPEDYLIPWCCAPPRPPVGWTEDREENLRAPTTRASRSTRWRSPCAPTARCLRCATASSSTPAPTCAPTATVVPNMTAALLPGPYRWGAYDCDGAPRRHQQDAGRHLPRAGPLRGQLRARALIDIAARRLGLDPPSCAART